MMRNTLPPVASNDLLGGGAGALARNEREARNSYSVNRLRLRRAAHAPAGEGARAPSTNRLIADRIDFLGKVSSTVTCQ